MKKNALYSASSWNSTSYSTNPVSLASRRTDTESFSLLRPVLIFFTPRFRTEVVHSDPSKCGTCDANRITTELAPPRNVSSNSKLTDQSRGNERETGAMQMPFSASPCTLCSRNLRRRSHDSASLPSLLVLDQLDGRLSVGRQCHLLKSHSESWNSLSYSALIFIML